MIPSAGHRAHRKESMLFQSRRDAGQRLAAMLSTYAHRPDVVVLALPRGGVPVGHEIAQALGAPLDLWIVRPLAAPGRHDVCMGAVASGGVTVLDGDLISAL